MPDASNIQHWTETIRRRYENYLKTSFHFKDPHLRESFQVALQQEGNLMNGPFPEPARNFLPGKKAQALALECFPRNGKELLPALIDRSLYKHQEQAIRSVHLAQQNIVVATGTASGKTESFLYPILFELYNQYIVGRLQEPGVRAMILYPMNALANDQRERLGKICEDLHQAGSDFKPTFGQYIGQTPKNPRDSYRDAQTWEEKRLQGEIVFREDMRKRPPHILLTNYSMLEYLLIRPEDSPLFDGNMGKLWQFIVLDEAHQYRGTKGMEMGMLIRRLKARLRDGGRNTPFTCIATSATISSGETSEDKEAIAEFANELFGEPFTESGVIFGESESHNEDESPSRYHVFLRALEGAFLVHKDGHDTVVLNRKSGKEDGSSKPLEIALCGECGQHYYVGRNRAGKLEEANRDPSHSDFGVDYYLPIDDGDELLCRHCSSLSSDTDLSCECGASIRVKRCQPHREHVDRIKECEICGYRRGGIGDPVQEIVHGSDGPNAVIATTLHELLPPTTRKVLTFVDNRQEAAFFAWYAQDSYDKLRDRNFIYRSIKSTSVPTNTLSIEDLQNRLYRQWNSANMFHESDTDETKNRRVLTSIFREVITDEKRISLAGVGLSSWFIELPKNLELPESSAYPPWNFTDEEATLVIQYLLDEIRLRRALSLPTGNGVPNWSDISPWPERAFCSGTPGRRRNVSEWGSKQSTVVRHFLPRLISNHELSDEDKRAESVSLMKEVWSLIRKYDRSCQSNEDKIFFSGPANGTFVLNSRWLRIKLSDPDTVWMCNICATLSTYNIRFVCSRNKCPGTLSIADRAELENNHYRILYQIEDFPPILKAEEHTAQIANEEARQRQERFKNGETHLLSSSTTFEVGVDLGDLEAVFLRNVPPESFNYTQRIGRAGRRGTPGIALTYCRRNPHDLYHYEDPIDRVINGKVKVPQLQMINKKIIIRHMVAVALSDFFKLPSNRERFSDVDNFIQDWLDPSALSDLRSFCQTSDALRYSLHQIVPSEMHDSVGLIDDTWIDNITGERSRLAQAEIELCTDHSEIRRAKDSLIQQQNWAKVGQLAKRIKTIEGERTLDFLSRKAIIPKYGFPVDVVELDTRSSVQGKVSLQRDLSQAIAEYAPGGKVIANKLEWESYGLKMIPNKALPVRYYQYDKARNFIQSEFRENIQGANKKYISPIFGFVTQLFKRPKEPTRRSSRLYTTRPFFSEFEPTELETKNIHGVNITKASSGTLVILCEGKNGGGFYICGDCGTHMTEPRGMHKSPFNHQCSGTLSRYSLGYELVTDVVRLQFPQLIEEWEAYSVAYAVLMGASKTLNVPNNDLNVTITAGDDLESAVVLYDNVPGGAGLVTQLEGVDVFNEMLNNALERIRGNCGCSSSCYGCLRSYRNQFAHPYLDRVKALEFLSGLAKSDEPHYQDGPEQLL